MHARFGQGNKTANQRSNNTMKTILKKLRNPLTSKTERKFFNGKWFETKRFYFFGIEIKQWKEHYQIFPFETEIYKKIYSDMYH